MVSPFLCLGVAGHLTECRRSAFLAPPATQIRLSRHIASQVGHFLQTCDISMYNLRRSYARPATLHINRLYNSQNISKFAKTPLTMDIEDIIYDLRDWWEDTVFDIKAFFNRLKDKSHKPSVDIDAKTPQECYDIWVWRKKDNDVGDKTSKLLLKKAADAGIPGALDEMAWQLRNGKLFKKDLAKAENYAKQGAIKGHIGCQMEMGQIMKDKGQCKEAVWWFKKVAEQAPDQGYAMFLIAQMYEKGAPGLEPDRAEAIMWYKKASKTTNLYAQEAAKILKRMNAPAFEEGE